MAPHCIYLYFTSFFENIPGHIMRNIVSESYAFSVAMQIKKINNTDSCFYKCGYLSNNIQHLYCNTLSNDCLVLILLTHWGWVTHICISKLTIVGSDNGLSPGWHQAIIRTNAGILLIGPLGINFNEILIGIQTFSLEKIHLKMASGKWRPFCLGLNVLFCTILLDFMT